MEAALNRTAKEYSRYGSTTHKQVYLYGGLDTGPIELVAQLRHGLGRGRLAAVPVPAAHRRRTPRRRCKARVAAELKTTFASHYTRTVSLAGALQADAIADYGRRATASKVLIDPSA